MSDEKLDTAEHTAAHGDKVKGYRKLSDEEITIINQIKGAERSIGVLIAATKDFGNADPRWLAIAKTDLEKGFMALVRAVAKPDGMMDG